MQKHPKISIKIRFQKELPRIYAVCFLYVELYVRHQLQPFPFFSVLEIEPFSSAKFFLRFDGNFYVEEGKENSLKPKYLVLYQIFLFTLYLLHLFLQSFRIMMLQAYISHSFAVRSGNVLSFHKCFRMKVIVLVYISEIYDVVSPARYTR